jgi:hypothetical protein
LEKLKSIRGYPLYDYSMSLYSPHEFYQIYKDNPVLGRREAFNIGQRMGLSIRERENIQGESLEDLSELLDFALRDVYGEYTTRVEEGELILCNTGFCAIMRSALNHNIPWMWVDEYFAWPLLEGLTSIMRPDVELIIPSARCRGDKECIHVFKLKKE